MNTESNEVSFTGVVERLAPTIERLERAGVPPMIGSHEWLDLPLGSALSVAAIYRAACMWALHLDERQADSIESSKAIAAERDWAMVSRQLRDRADARKSGAYIERTRGEAS